MARTISIGAQDFADLRENECFYIDKTDFISEWWKSKDKVTLITRPRRFGKTLNMKMTEAFFSKKYAGKGEELFSGLDVWQDEGMRSEQGEWPVIFLTFAGIKFRDYKTSRRAMNGLLATLFRNNKELLCHDDLDDELKAQYSAVHEDMSDDTAAMSLNFLCYLLEMRFHKKAIVLLDEYDTPMQEAWTGGFWDEMTGYIRSFFNNTFKTNPYLERALMTGITRVSRESIFSDLNNINVVTTTSDEYATAFGFTEEEVFSAMEEQGLEKAYREKVKNYYDGFTFGQVTDIYNPWSITHFLKKKKFGAYWADSSSNSLVGSIIQKGDKEIKESFEDLLSGGSIEAFIDEQIVFSQLKGSANAVWSLLLASGYLKVLEVKAVPDPADLLGDEMLYILALTNTEVKSMFRKMVSGWFANEGSLPDFIKAMLSGNTEDMNSYMNRIALNTFSNFDTGVKPADNAPERFYHGFVLGLMVEKSGEYTVKSNRESGYGRYDVVMEPIDKSNPAVIMEFKVFNGNKGEKKLEDTAANALKQIEDRKYDTDLISRGISRDRIYRYGFAFRGSECLIQKG